MLQRLDTLSSNVEEQRKATKADLKCSADHRHCLQTTSYSVLKRDVSEVWVEDKAVVVDMETIHEMVEGIEST
jgi:hypothetical protein